MSLKEQVSTLLRERGVEFDREDLGELRFMLVREKDWDEARLASEAAFGTLALVVNDAATYRGDLTQDDLAPPTRGEVADGIIAGLLG